MYRPESENQQLDENRQGEALVGYEIISSVPKRYFYIESYGCAMNFSDSEIVASILNQEGMVSTRELIQADLILINTCSIREKAEETVRKRLTDFKHLKKEKPDLIVGVLGCMAERLKAKFIEEEKLVDIVVGPDAYRDLPNLLSKVDYGEKGVNVFLSREETYADIAPLRLDSNGVSAFISIMRGCDNMCSFCVVPYTRGRERSRSAFTIIAEAEDLFQKGYREVTLLGQNVDSYKWHNTEQDQIINFAELLEMVALVNPLLRIRFSTSHPKDITNEVLYTIAKYPNICNYIHLPIQSGSSRILSLMNRTYDREWYMNRVRAIYQIIPDCAISSDIITGFCSETELDHKETLSVIEWAKYTMSYMFYYSERPGTPAAKKLTDDVPLEIKKSRLSQIIELQREVSFQLNQLDIGKTFEVLIEGDSKRSDKMFKGRNSQNKIIIFEKKPNYYSGIYVNVKVTSATSATLSGEII
ncbi:MAG: tRNA (N6-isopentenyl adenosine(37)-C2)-methylthiotransferase MiaB [Saprospiraceae bacterium]|jgi:tRNA-2-methylthio-N6-dimethylallyladenosine synthase|nr:tRNA (N6-isopentenyl adenosine(37)-C2)-methylthiotransferase MiaB [Saprospiraceae bacterium]